MLSTVEVITRQGTQLILPFADDTSPYLVAEIEGLDPVKATLVSSSFAQEDGAQFQSARREARNIKITLELQPDWQSETAESLRKALYPFLMPKSEVTLRFLDSNGTAVMIDGRVESLAATPFAQDPAVDVSLMCFKPDFLGENQVTFSGTSTSANPADANFFDGATYVYDGTVETGFSFSFRALHTLSEFTIYHRLPWGEVRSIRIQEPMVLNDVFTINSVPGAKGAYLLRNGVTESRLYSYPPQAPWLEFEHGDNGFRVVATDPVSPFDVTYTPRYGGL